MNKKNLYLNIIFGIIGIILIAFFLNRIGIDNILTKIKESSSGILLLLILPIFWFLFHALGTHFTLNSINRKNIGILRLTLLQAVSYGISWAQPMQGIVGEPIKLLFLDKKKHDLEDFSASLMIDNTINLLSNLIITFGAIVAIGTLSTIPTIVKIISYITLFVIVILFLLLIHIQKNGIFSAILKIFKKLKVLKKFREAKAEPFAKIDQNINHFYTHRKKDFFASLTFHFMERLYGVGEFYLIFMILSPNNSISIITCLFIFGIINMIDNVLFFIQIGGMESYTSLLLESLGLSLNQLNLTVPLFRRIRMLFWSIIALMIFLPLKKIIKN